MVAYIVVGVEVFGVPREKAVIGDWDIPIPIPRFWRFKMKRLAAAILVCLALSPVSVFAKPFLIRAAGVQIELPEYWGVREREGILMASPRDGTLLLVFWVVAARDLDEALKKIFPGLRLEPGEELLPTLEVAGTQDSSSEMLESGKDQKLVLSKFDYDKIRRTYRTVLESQTQLDQSMLRYRAELKEFGEILEETPVSLQAEAP